MPCTTTVGLACTVCFGYELGTTDVDELTYCTGELEGDSYKPVTVLAGNLETAVNLLL
jgi:hypothetical protein